MEVLLLIYGGKVGGLTCGFVRLVVSVMYYASREWGFLLFLYLNGLCECYDFVEM